jgi:hypothetical protein
VANATLTEEERHWRPSLDILIKCSWRLQSAKSVMAAGFDGGLALRQLVGRAVEDVQTEAPGWDLALRLSGDLCLMVFADETRDGYENFSVGVRDSYWTVNAKSLISWG